MNRGQAYAIINRAIELIEDGHLHYSCYALNQAANEYELASYKKKEVFHNQNLSWMYRQFTRANWLYVQTDSLNRMGRIKRVWFALRGYRIPDLPHWWDSLGLHTEERVKALKAFRGFMLATL